MSVANLSGGGMALIRGLSGVPVSSVGVLINADILIPAFVRNMQDAVTVFNGSKTGIGGLITQQPQNPV